MRGEKNVKSLVSGPNHCRLAVIRCLCPSNLHFFTKFQLGACWGKGVKNVKSVVEGLKHCVYAMIGCPAPCFEVIFCEIRARIRGRGGR